ncbi:nuclear transport factor 2 family protein [Nocardioides acrostichi]|uniref:Nuclear transport factor 2 family protein n=1 Tax=Nocardioides acrostichi TaxID=2784339 RepID=A0A930UX10_9ACTN|nr:nuclear transport factor 2 family protein [Nocardioides acrostichi]MBF4162433.1 nuclear transport factor 2 family protein [Nocardioides acrostichi]
MNESTEECVALQLQRLSLALQLGAARPALACFTSEASFYGDDLDEEVHGAADLGCYLEELAEGPVPTWEPVRVRARRRHGLIWFVAACDAVVRYPDGLSERTQLRVSGVLVKHSRRWLFDLLEVSRPSSAREELWISVGAGQQTTA